MIELQRILHPTDFSDNSREALKYACSMAERFGAELHIIVVVADAVVTVSPPMAGFLPEGYYQDVMESAENNASTVPIRL